MHRAPCSTTTPMTPLSLTSPTRSGCIATTWSRAGAWASRRWRGERAEANRGPSSGFRFERSNRPGNTSRRGRCDPSSSSVVVDRRSRAGTYFGERSSGQGSPPTVIVPLQCPPLCFAAIAIPPHFLSSANWLFSAFVLAASSPSLRVPLNGVLSDMHGSTLLPIFRCAGRASERGNSRRGTIPGLCLRARIGPVADDNKSPKLDPPDRDRVYANYLETSRRGRHPRSAGASRRIDSRMGCAFQRGGKPLH